MRRVVARPATRADEFDTDTVFGQHDGGNGRVGLVEGMVCNQMAFEVDQQIGVEKQLWCVPPAPARHGPGTSPICTPRGGVVFKAYKIADIYSRQIVGYRVEDRESDQHAVDMFATAAVTYGAPCVVHADNGPAMTSNLLRDHLHRPRHHAVTQPALRLRGQPVL